ncbi:MAG TPA: SpoIIE family protein phosphatase [Candidatus Sulfotelmatobacter sp.]|jgi:sigma-B regulation protein RsbU (phosphoserine phosphatase)|nr:SpoIIE family protein phosphatase [Candidatus Sulfotelmatobacter sp.]
MQWSYPELRRKLIEADLWPQGRMARLACYLAALAVVLFALEKLLGLFSLSWGEHLGGWVTFLTFLACVLFFILGFRWVKRRILWRLRNRLIVTYMFIGVIPAVLLVAMGLITLYGLGGQFAVFVVTSETDAQLRSLAAVNATVSSELAAHLERGEKPVPESLAGLIKRDPAWSRRQVCAWYGDKPLPLCNEFHGDSIAFPGFIKSKFQDLVRDHERLHLRVGSSLEVGSNRLTVVTSEPFDKDLVGKIAEGLGEITLYTTAEDQSSPKQQAPATTGVKDKTPVSSTPKRTSGFVINANDNQRAASPGGPRVLHPAFTVGSMPESTASFDREITFGTPLPVVDWENGTSDKYGPVLQVTTRPAVLYSHLFAALGEFVRGVTYILMGVAIFFAIIELIALIIGTRMTRTVTAAVADLHVATRHVDRGDFSHRIPVKSSDQLADLANSFNSMTASIEKLMLEQREKQRLENELAIAQEVQDQLFPRQTAGLESLEVHGFCRPARTVSGDYYDFLSASSHKLILAVGDISGKGISAALLMATIHSAVRAYSVENLPQMREPVAVGAVAGSGRIMATWPEGIEVSPGALLGLLNHQLFESTPPEKYATLFVGIYDGRSRTLTYSNGGHLPPILIGKDGTVRRLEAGGTVVGLFDGMTYEEDSVVMVPGEVFLAYSDGVTEPENDFGEFGEQRLIELVRENRNLPLPQISQIVTMAVDDWIGDNEQPDDVTLVLARAR